MIAVAHQEIEQESGFTAPHVFLVLSYIRRGNIEAARDALEQLSKPHREWSSVHSAIGAVALAEKNYQEAIDNYERAAELEPNISHRSEFYRQIGIAQMRLKNFKKASFYFKKAYSQQPKLRYLVTLHFMNFAVRFGLITIPLYMLSLFASIWMISWWILIPISVTILFHGGGLLVALLNKNYSQVQRSAYQAAGYIIIATVIRQLLGRSVPW